MSWRAIQVVALDMLLPWRVNFSDRPKSLTRPCKVPILKEGQYVIASIQSALTDADLAHLRVDLLWHVGRHRSKGVVIDVTALDLIDSFVTRNIRDLAQAVRLRGARAVIVGIQPEVAFTMVQLGLELGDVATALDLEEGLELLRDVT